MDPARYFQNVRCRGLRGKFKVVAANLPKQMQLYLIIQMQMSYANTAQVSGSPDIAVDLKIVRNHVDVNVNRRL